MLNAGTVLIDTCVPAVYTSLSGKPWQTGASIVELSSWVLMRLPLRSEALFFTKHVLHPFNSDSK